MSSKTRISEHGTLKQAIRAGPPTMSVRRATRIPGRHECSGRDEALVFDDCSLRARSWPSPRGNGCLPYEATAAYRGRMDGREVR